MRGLVAVGRSLVALWIASIWPGLIFAQNSVSLAEQLKAQYKVSKRAADSSGVSVVEAGTILSIQKGGILGVPPASVAIAPATFKDGDLHPPGAGARMFIGNNTRLLQVGEMVYLLKLDVNTKGDKISFMIQECDSCNQFTQPSGYKSQVTFQFPKGYLETANVLDIEDTISKVFTIVDSNNQQQSAQAAPEPAAAVSPVQQTQNIRVGQTPAEVEAALGKPETIATAGSKQIYKYKDLKVIFIDGKVSDIQ